MVTDDERRFAKKRSREIAQNHADKGHSGCEARHMSTEISYAETLRRGMLGEFAFVHEFAGVAVNGAILDYGDGGLDFSPRLMIRSGRRRFPVNVKAKSVRVSWPALLRSGTHLRVPVIECKPWTIYVFGLYLERTDDAEVLAWEWGVTLIKRNERRIFPKSKGGETYLLPFEKLRDLRELKEREFFPEDLFAACDYLARSEC